MDADGSVGEINNFHLTSRQRLCRWSYYSLAPSQLQVHVAILKVHPVLDATEITVVIIIQYGREFCGSKVLSVRVPISHLSPPLLGRGSEETRAS